MTDDGGFRPHPGDPWHPDWTLDAEPGDEPASELAPPEDEIPEPEPDDARRALFGLFRRRRRKDADDAVEQVERVAPDDAGEDYEDEEFLVTPEPGHYEIEHDPFEDVLRAEGRPVRRRSSDDQEAPEPAWTSDAAAPDPYQEVPEAVETGADELADAFEPAGDDEPEIEGEYGVAGPEAFDALAEPVDESLDQWEAFAAGEAVEEAVEDVAPQVEREETVADADDLDEWIESEEPRKRRWFGRRRGAEPDTEPEGPPELGGEDHELAAGVAGVDYEPADHEPLADEADAGWDDREPDHSPFMPPEDVAEPPLAVDDEMADIDDEAVEVEDGSEAAVAEALAALGVPIDDSTTVEEVMAPTEEGRGDEEDVAPEVSGEIAFQLDDERPTDHDEPLVDASLGVDLEEESGEPADSPTTESQPEVAETPRPEVDEPGRDPGPAEPAAVADDALPSEAIDEEPVELPAGEGPVPSAWMSDVDQDDAAPASDAEDFSEGGDDETPLADELELGEEPAEVADDGAPVVDEDVSWGSSSEDVFDVDVVPDPAALEEAAEPAVPDGYEPWDDAVAEATAEDVEDTAEYQVQHVPPPPAEIPEGFEPFPGTAADEEAHASDTEPEDRRSFEIEPDEAPDEPLPLSHPEDAAPDEEVAADHDVELDEDIYVSGGTVEHRGLADAIAAAGDEETEWQALSAAMPGVETGVLGFDDVADLADEEEYVAPVRSNLGVRVATGVVLVALLIGSLLAAGWAFSLFVGVIVLLGLGEFYWTLRRVGLLPLTLFGMLGGGATLLALWYHGPLAIPAGVLLTSVVTFFYYAFAPTRQDALTNGGLTVLGVAWVAGGVGFAIPIARADDYVVLVLAVVAVTAAMDIGAYSFGRTWGRRSLAPVMSPNKTVEGLFGGILAAMAAAGAVGYLAPEWFELRAALALGAVVVVAAPLGDLAESLVKRSMGVKDMGSTLPGHGGILDRIDALVFVIPAAWVLFESIGYLG